MTLEVNRAFIGCALLVVLISAAVGRATAPEKVRVETKTVEVEKKTEDQQKVTNTDTDRDRHREVTTTETIKPDGTKEITTKTVEDTKTDRKTDQQVKTDITDTTQKTTEEKKEVTRGSSLVTVSLLVGTSLQFSGGFNTGPVVYGASVSRPLLGPIALGLWGLDDRTFGVSLGLNF